MEALYDSYKKKTVKIQNLSQNSKKKVKPIINFKKLLTMNALAMLSTNCYTFFTLSFLIFVSIYNSIGFCYLYLSCVSYKMNPMLKNLTNKH